jgi:hypothetical protein
MRQISLESLGRGERKRNISQLHLRVYVHKTVIVLTDKETALSLSVILACFIHVILVAEKASLL